MKTLGTLLGLLCLGLLFPACVSVEPAADSTVPVAEPADSAPVPGPSDETESELIGEPAPEDQEPPEVPETDGGTTPPPVDEVTPEDSVDMPVEVPVEPPPPEEPVPSDELIPPDEPAPSDEPSDEEELLEGLQSDCNGDGVSDLEELFQGHDPCAPAQGPDNDGDGIANGADPDIDNDGLLNGDDNDTDGDGIHNANDPDVDGDELFNDEDDDIDGDGIINAYDIDVDADGAPNSLDPDADGDGATTEFDWDDDNDDDPDGADDSEPCDPGLPPEKRDPDCQGPLNKPLPAQVNQPLIDVPAEAGGEASWTENPVLNGANPDDDGDDIPDVVVTEGTLVVDSENEVYRPALQLTLMALDVDSDGFSDTDPFLTTANLLVKALNDMQAGGVDADKDGIPNAVDLDDDNDGLNDAFDPDDTDAATATIVQNFDPVNDDY